MKLYNRIQFGLIRYLNGEVSGKIHVLYFCQFLGELYYFNIFRLIKLNIS